MINTEFLLTSLAVILIPGTGAIYTITTGITHKGHASLAAAFGCTLGILPHILASVLGLSAILNMSAHIFSAIKMVGAAYLLYLAWNMWREAGKLEFKQEEQEANAGQIILKAVTINLLNPKLTLFFFSFLPLFITENSSAPTAEMLLLSAVFMGLTLLVFALYGLLASSVRTYLLNSSRAVKRMQQAFAVVIAAFAVKLALTDQ